MIFWYADKSVTSKWIYRIGRIILRISADDLTFVIDTADFSSERIRESHAEFGELSILKQKTTADEISIRIDSNDVTRIVDIRRERCQAIRKIERAERAIVIKKTVGMPVRKRFRNVIVKIKADDLADVVNRRRTGDRRTWKSDIEPQEQAAIPKKAMEISSGIVVVTDYLPVVVDPNRFG